MRVIMTEILLSAQLHQPASANKPLVSKLQRLGKGSDRPPPPLKLLVHVYQKQPLRGRRNAPHTEKAAARHPGRRLFGLACA